MYSKRKCQEEEDMDDDLSEDVSEDDTEDDTDEDEDSENKYKVLYLEMLKRNDANGLHRTYSEAYPLPGLNSSSHLQDKELQLHNTLPTNTESKKSGSVDGLKEAKQEELQTINTTNSDSSLPNGATQQQSNHSILTPLPSTKKLPKTTIQTHSLKNTKTKQSS